MTFSSALRGVFGSASRTDLRLGFVGLRLARLSFASELRLGFANDLQLGFAGLRQARLNFANGPSARLLTSTAMSTELRLDGALARPPRLSASALVSNGFGFRFPCLRFNKYHLHLISPGIYFLCEGSNDS